MKSFLKKYTQTVTEYQKAVFKNFITAVVECFLNRFGNWIWILGRKKFFKTNQNETKTIEEHVQLILIWNLVIWPSTENVLKLMFLNPIWNVENIKHIEIESKRLLKSYVTLGMYAHFLKIGQ
jgi:hypothetical protein